MTKDEITHAEEVIQSSKNRLEEERAQLVKAKKQLDLMEEFWLDYKRLTELVAKQEQQIAAQEKEIEALKKETMQLKNENLQLKDENKQMKDENKQLKMERDELNKMSQKLVEKSEQEVVIKWLRSYMNISKRKSAKKRGYIKMVILEEIQNANLEIPEDMREELERFDDAVRRIDDPCHFIHPAVKEEDEIMGIHREIANLACNFSIPNICQYLNKMESERKILQPTDAKRAMAELQRLGMPGEETDGFSFKNFCKYYKRQ